MTLPDLVVLLVELALSGALAWFFFGRERLVSPSWWGTFRRSG